MQNRIIELFKENKKEVLSIFFTAGFPYLDSTKTIIETLEKSGAELLEIGMPYSDPVADGETIQMSNKIALDNGMSIKLLFEQIKDIRKTVEIPLILMGYLNPIVQYGVERFCKKAVELGIDGVILPDLPIDLYIDEYKDLFEKYNLSNILLVTPQTSDTRIKMIDENTSGFIYMVSDDSITGKTGQLSEKQIEYFNRVNAMELKNPRIIGFGISNHHNFSTACQYASGAIIGSAFIRAIHNSNDLEADIKRFVSGILKPA